MKRSNESIGERVARIETLVSSLHEEFMGFKTNDFHSLSEEVKALKKSPSWVVAITLTFMASLIVGLIVNQVK